MFLGSAVPQDGDSDAVPGICWRNDQFKRQTTADWVNSLFLQEKRGVVSSDGVELFSTFNNPLNTPPSKKKTIYQTHITRQTKKQLLNGVNVSSADICTVHNDELCQPTVRCH